MVPSDHCRGKHSIRKTSQRIWNEGAYQLSAAIFIEYDIEAATRGRGGVGSIEVVLIDVPVGHASLAPRDMGGGTWARREHNMGE
jgi:hypothetical protein